MCKKIPSQGITCPNRIWHISREKNHYWFLIFEWNPTKNKPEKTIQKTPINYEFCWMSSSEARRFWPRTKEKTVSDTTIQKTCMQLRYIRPKKKNPIFYFVPSKKKKKLLYNHKTIKHHKIEPNRNSVLCTACQFLCFLF